MKYNYFYNVVLEVDRLRTTDAIRKLIIKPTVVKLQSDEIKLSNTKAYPWTKTIYSAKKTVFNKVPCENHLELEFAKFLDNADDVIAFSKLTQQSGFSIEYLSTKGALRLYIPDFVIKTTNGMYLAETKGLEDLEVERKDERVMQWCKDATKLTKENWNYIKVLQDRFISYQYKTFMDLVNAE